LNNGRPIGVITLVLLFAIGACASFISAVSLTFPGSFLEPIWSLNPHARTGFTRIGSAAIALMIAVCIACTFTTIGLWLGRRWGYWLAVVMLVIEPLRRCGQRHHWHRAKSRNRYPNSRLDPGLSSAQTNERHFSDSGM
jgi:hypothetical protein